MSQRPGILTTHKEAHPSLPSPNSHAPWITAEVRLHWPLGTLQDNAQHALLMAYLKASDQIQRKYADEAKVLADAKRLAGPQSSSSE
jgi:hypothetical protein